MELYPSSGWERVSQLRENEVFTQTNINIMIPLIDMPNHWHPKLLNRSDYYGFGLKVFPSSPGHLTSPRMKSIAVNTQHPLKRSGDQVDYAYNQNLEAFKLLSHYGFAVDNNPFAQVTLKS